MAISTTFTDKARAGTVSLPAHMHNTQQTNTWEKRDANKGGFIDRKQDGTRFKRAPQEIKNPSLEDRQLTSSNLTTHLGQGQSATNNRFSMGTKKSLPKVDHNASTTLVLCRGLPGSGKSTKAGVLAEIGFQHFEADMYFERDGNYRYDSTRIREAHEWCQQVTREALGRGQNVVVSNTFTRVSEMNPYFEMGAGNIRVIEAKGRWKNVHGVPSEVVQKMASRWELLPTKRCQDFCELGS